MFIRAGHLTVDVWDWATEYLVSTPVIVNFKVVEGKKSEAYPWADEENKEKWVTTQPDYLQNFCDQDPDEYWVVTHSVEGGPSAKSAVYIVNCLPFYAKTLYIP